MKLTEDDIKEINLKCKDSWNEGVFSEPNGIPCIIKEPVIYMRWNKSGYSGGNCWGDSAEYYECNKPDFSVIDLVLEKLMPNISYLNHKKISSLIQTNSDTNYEYYGNSDDYEIEYIVLSELYKLLEKFS